MDVPDFPIANELAAWYRSLPKTEATVGVMTSSRDQWAKKDLEDTLRSLFTHGKPKLIFGLIFCRPATKSVQPRPEPQPAVWPKPAQPQMG